MANLSKVSMKARELISNSINTKKKIVKSLKKQNEDLDKLLNSRWEDMLLVEKKDKKFEKYFEKTIQKHRNNLRNNLIKKYETNK